MNLQWGSAMAKSYGTVSAEQKAQMSGLEFVQGLASGALPLNTIAQTLGYDVTEAERGRVVVTLLPTDAHLNPAGTVHGRTRPGHPRLFAPWRSRRGCPAQGRV